MSEVVDKQRVKNLLENNNEMADKIKATMINSDDWKNFRNGICELVEEYSKNPTPETEQKMNALILKYSRDSRDCLEAISSVFRYFGVSQIIPVRSRKPESKTKRDNDHSREIFERIGIEHPADVVEESDRQIEEFENRKYGINKTRRTPKSDEPKRTVKNPKANPKVKKQGTLKSEIVKAAKKAYFKMTASIIMAPGKVPPEVLAENRKILEEASSKLDKLVEELETADGISHKANADKSLIDSLPDELKSQYTSMREGEMSEEEIGEFEEVLSNSANKRIETIRSAFTHLQNAKLEQELTVLISRRIPDMPVEDIQKEVELIVKGITIDEDGMLSLPKKSAFNELLFDENGNVFPDRKALVYKLGKYAKAPKVSELSDDELLSLAKNVRKLDEVRPKSKEGGVAKFLFEELDFVPDDAEEKLGQIEANSKGYPIIVDALDETELRHKLILAKNIQGQFGVIRSIVGSLDEKEKAKGGLGKEDSKQRETLLKIARKKVASLEKVGLSKIITDGEKKNREIMKDARGLLLPDLENARDRGERRLEKEVQEQEDPEVSD